MDDLRIHYHLVVNGYHQGSEQVVALPIADDPRLKQLELDVIAAKNSMEKQRYNAEFWHSEAIRLSRRLRPLWKRLLRID